MTAPCLLRPRPPFIDRSRDLGAGCCPSAPPRCSHPTPGATLMATTLATPQDIARGVFNIVVTTVKVASGCLSAKVKDYARVCAACLTAAKKLLGSCISADLYSLHLYAHRAHSPRHPRRPSLVHVLAQCCCRCSSELQSCRPCNLAELSRPCLPMQSRRPSYPLLVQRGCECSGLRPRRPSLVLAQRCCWCSELQSCRPCRPLQSRRPSQPLLVQRCCQCSALFPSLGLFPLVRRFRCLSVITLPFLPYTLGLGQYPQ